MTTRNHELRFQCWLVCGLAIAFHANAQPIDEYQVKAAFLYNFARYIDWPAVTFRSDKDPVRICVLGRDPFGSGLPETVKGRTLGSKSFAVSNVADASQITGCQILFISSSEQKRIPAILSAVPSVGVLTVGESDGFATHGGIVNFILEDGRVRFQINRQAAERAHLQISSKLLNLAQIVDK